MPRSFLLSDNSAGSVPFVGDRDQNGWVVYPGGRRMPWWMSMAWIRQPWPVRVWVMSALMYTALGLLSMMGAIHISQVPLAVSASRVMTGLRKVCMENSTVLVD